MIPSSYDSHGIFSSPRALFTFRSFGHELSSVINGGLLACEAAGFPTESGATATLAEHVKEYPTVTFDVRSVRDYEQVVVSSSKLSQGIADAELVLDARPRGRWAGVDPEPRLNMPSGHIPHSLSLPFSSLLETNTISGSDAKFTSLFQPAKLKTVVSKTLGEKRFVEVMQGRQSVVNTCGSGMTAAIVWLAFQMLGVNSAIYDESWTGYVAREGSRIDTESTN